MRSFDNAATILRHGFVQGAGMHDKATMHEPYPHNITLMSILGHAAQLLYCSPDLTPRTDADFGVNSALLAGSITRALD